MLPPFVVNKDYQCVEMFNVPNLHAAKCARQFTEKKLRGSVIVVLYLIVIVFIVISHLR